MKYLVYRLIREIEKSETLNNIEVFYVNAEQSFKTAHWIECESL